MKVPIVCGRTVDRRRVTSVIRTTHDLRTNLWKEKLKMSVSKNALIIWSRCYEITLFDL